MNLSARANAYWTHTGRSASEEQRFSSVEQYFQVNLLPHAAPFIECVALVGGMVIDVPSDRIHFFSTFDMERLAKVSVKTRFFFDDPAGEWYYACDSWYPGRNCLHKSGSFHFEQDPNEKWANSLAEIIESAALLWSIGKSRLKFRVNAIFNAPSLSVLGERLECVRDPYASSSLREFYCYGGGVVEAYRVHQFERHGGCGIGAVLPTREAASALEEALGGLVSSVMVRPEDCW